MRLRCAIRKTGQNGDTGTIRAMRFASDAMHGRYEGSEGRNMGNKKNVVCQELNRIKEKHGLTNESWANLSGVPKGTVNRYLSYNSGIPNYAYVCAMLKCVGESIDEFDRGISSAGALPADLASAPAAEAELKSDPLYDPTLVPSMQERIAEQSEKLQELQGLVQDHDMQLQEKQAAINARDAQLQERQDFIHEQDAQLRVLRAENQGLETRLRDSRKLVHYLTIFAGLLLAVIIIYFFWEIKNLDKGVTALMYPDLK